MASIFRVMGLLAGRAMKNHAVNVAVNTTSRFVWREMRLADIKLKLGLLRKKRRHHLLLMGRTVYRLSANGAQDFDLASTRTLTSVLVEIDCEIEAARDELERRKAEQRPGSKS